MSRQSRTASPAPGDPKEAVAEAVLRQASDAIVVTTLDGVVTSWNAAAERVYGLSAEEALGRKFSEVVSTSYPDGGTDEAILDDVRRLGTWSGLVEQTPLRGALAREPRLIDAVLTTIRTERDAPTALVAINRDVTPTERLEREFATLASLAAAASRHRAPEEIAAASLETLARATGASGGTILALHGERLHVVASRGLSARTLQLVEGATFPGGTLAAGVAGPTTVVVAPLATAPFRQEIRAAAAADGVDHVLFTGLWTTGRLVGVLGLSWPMRPPSLPSDSAVLQAAALVAAVVEHARLDARLAHALEVEQSVTAGLQTLVRLTRLTTAVRDEASFAELALAEIARTLGAAGGVILRIAGETVGTLAAHNLHPALDRLCLERRASDWGFVQRLRTGEGPFIGPFASAAFAASSAAAADAGYETYAVVPVRRDDGLDAVLVLLFAEPESRLSVDTRTLGAVERILEIAFANQRLRRAVAASERRYRTLFERSPLGMVVADRDGAIVAANAAAEAIYGSKPGGLLGRSMRSLSREPPPVVEERRRIVTTSGGGRFDHLGRRLDGSPFPAEATVAKLGHGPDAEYFTILRDLSERQRLEDELVQAQKMDAIGRLVAGVAHELNNPLASIVGFSQLIRDDPELPANLRENAELLVAEADRTRRIVQNLLDFARRRPPERVPTRLSALVRSVVELSSYGLKAADVEVEVDVPSDLPPVPIDRAQLQQVLLNLATNSIHAIRSANRPGRLRFCAVPLGGDPPFVRLTVADDGPGVPTALRERLFEPFFTTKPAGEGTGLGLSVSLGIVESHGGRISFEPGPRGRGARFHVDLPTVIAGEEDGARRVDRSRARGAATGGRTRRRSNRVLALDDEAAIRVLLEKALRTAGFRPVVVPSGSAALAAAADGPVAAVLCDYRMPDMTGIELFETLTAEHPELARRFVFMSGDVLNRELREFATARGIGLLAKPFDVASVGRVVRGVLAS